MRLSRLDKLEIAKKHVDEGIPINELAHIYKCDVARIKYSISLYKLHGEKAFLGGERQNTYTRELKLDAIKQVLSKQISARQLAIKLGLPDDKILGDWVSLYKKFGESAIKDTYSRSHYLKHEERLDYIADKSLKDRLLYLEAENEYLKKLYALTLKEKKLQKKK